MVVEFSAIAYLVLYLKEALFFAMVTAGFFLAILEAGGAFGEPITGLISDCIFRGIRSNGMVISGNYGNTGGSLTPFVREGKKRI